MTDGGINPSDVTTPMKAYLFGYPISHSLAPLLHNTLFADLNVPWTYELLESTNKDDLLEKLKMESCVGSAVTMPHKVEFVKEVDDTTDEGHDIGAINTVFKRIDAQSGKIKLIGTNTDCFGVRDAFLLNFPDIIEKSTGKPAMVIGSGGAARSCIYALWKWFGVSSIYIVNRREDEANGVIEHILATTTSRPIEFIYVKSVEEAEKLEGPALIIGAIPDKTPVTPEEVLNDKIKMTFLSKPTKGYVIEMCYHPNPITRFYRECESNGWKVIPGTEPMIYQGVAQQMLWTGFPLEKFSTENAAKAINKHIC
ncbi:hypothetical protein BZA70DRAFT_275947 [Myxozyma melibiosi]|uniref:Shikimate dehydrogenase substrate binding N-terminal domain-containing protein n=1 Tax=Myxozyma melibiosi TaxID=54550 RepID=A0ABR1FAN0_9ASCO